MDSIFENYKNNGYLHHAYIIEGAHCAVMPGLIFAIERNLNISTKKNPNVFIERYQIFGIEESCRLKILQSRTGFSGADTKIPPQKLFLISANSLTHEAQNSLLKIFEEPTIGTHFFIIIPHADIILPTLRSRVLIIKTKERFTKDEDYLFAKEFINVCLEDRFTLVKKLSEKNNNDKIDRELFRRVLDQIEIIISRHQKDTDSPIKNKDIFTEIYQAKTYLNFSGSSPRMLLEHIAIVLAKRS